MGGKHTQKKQQQNNKNVNKKQQDSFRKTVKQQLKTVHNNKTVLEKQF